MPRVFASRLTRVLLLVGGVVLVTIGPALAARHASASVVGGAAFGGGSDPSYTAGDKQNVLTLVSFTTARSGESLEALVDVSDFNCRGTAEAVFTLGDVRITPAGSFATSGKTKSLTTGQPSTTYRLAGSFINRHEATGTLTVRQPSCAMGTLHWRAGDAQAGGSGLRHGGKTYAGYFSQHSTHLPDVRLPFVLRVTPNAQALAGAASHVNLLPFSANCRSLTHFWQIGFTHRLGDRFSDREAFGPSPALEAGDVQSFQITWSGRFAAHRVTGTWRQVGELRRKSDKALVARCDSGPLSWQAIGMN